MKIVYIIESLATTGGVERMITEKANRFSEQYGFDVTILVCSQTHNQPNSYYLSKSVRQINLGFSFSSQYNYKYPKRLWVKHLLYKKFNEILVKNVHQLNPDILFGVGHFEAKKYVTLTAKQLRLSNLRSLGHFQDQD